MKHFLDGIEVTPRNLDEIGVTSDFSGNPEILSLNTDTIILPRLGNDIIRQHITTKGLFVALPYTITMASGITLEYYVDFCDPSAKTVIRQHECEIKIKKRKGNDDFFDRANGTSFELIVKQRGIDYFPIQSIPYLVIKDNVSEQALSLSITLFLMVKETIEAALRLAESLRDLALSFAAGGIVAAAIMVIARAVYLFALIYALTQLAQQLFAILIPIKRNLKGIYFADLFRKACEHLGYTFSSTLFANDPGWFLVPVPLNRDNDQSIFQELLTNLTGDFNKGYPTSTDTVGLFGDFIRELENMFNARTFVIGNVVNFERRDWLLNTSTNSIEPSLSLQDTRDDAYTFNVEEAWKRYYIHYQVDYTDLHTCEGDIYERHDAEYSCENSVPVPDNDLVTIKGLNEVSINFSMAANKDKLTYLENYVKNIYLIIDIFCGTNFAQQITDRTKCIKISQQYFSLTKACYVKQNGSQKVLLDPAKNDSNYSAGALYRRYHYINEIQNNNYIIKEGVRIRIREQDFVTLLNNNYVLINGNLAEILKLEWTDEKHDALITYREVNDWAVGKVTTQVING